MFVIDRKNFLMNLLKMISEYVNTLRKFQVVKDTNT